MDLPPAFIPSSIQPATRGLSTASPQPTTTDGLQDSIARLCISPAPVDSPHMPHTAAYSNGLMEMKDMIWITGDAVGVMNAREMLSRLAFAKVREIMCLPKIVDAHAVRLTETDRVYERGCGCASQAGLDRYREVRVTHHRFTWTLLTLSQIRGNIANHVRQRIAFGLCSRRPSRDRSSMGGPPAQRRQNVEGCFNDSTSCCRAIVDLVLSPPQFAEITLATVFTMPQHPSEAQGFDASLEAVLKTTSSASKAEVTYRAGQFQVCGTLSEVRKALPVILTADAVKVSLSLVLPTHANLVDL